MTGAGNNPLLQLTGLAKHFGGFAAVDKVSLEPPRGAIGGLIGPNGAGKTTLFNMLAGMLGRMRVRCCWMVRI